MTERVGYDDSLIKGRCAILVGHRHHNCKGHMHTGTCGESRQVPQVLHGLALDADITIAGGTCAWELSGDCRCVDVADSPGAGA